MAKDNQSNEYRSRINRVMDYIESNLEKPLTLDELAREASFSKYHFHRIFNALVGERLFEFIQRLRLEKAANKLLNNPKLSITEIAIDCGFGGSATFARAFKESFGMTASDWRKQGPEIKIKESLLESKLKESFPPGSVKLSYPEGEERWKISHHGEEYRITVKDWPEFEVAYIRHTGPYKGDAALFEGLTQRLFKWAGPRGLLNQPDLKFLIIYHDDPAITEEIKLRISICLSVPPGTRVEDEVGLMKVAGGRCAIARFTLGPEDYSKAWEWLYSCWLPQSGYQPDDRPTFEYYPQCEQPEEGKHYVDICLPVKPL